MKFWRLSDIPLVYKIGAAPIFATIAFFVAVASASWMQERQTDVMRQITYNRASESALAADAQKITAVNGKLYEIMAKRAAGAPFDDTANSVASLLLQIDAIKADLINLGPRLPAAQRSGFNSVLGDLINYRGAIQVAGSMLSVDFNTAANFIQPFEANYWRMTTALNTASQQLATIDATRADRSVEEASQIRKLRLVFAAGTLLGVTLLETLIVSALRRTVLKICEATEALAAGQNDIDLEKLERGDEFGAIVRALTVFRENQFRIIAMRIEQENMLEREEDSRRKRAHLVQMISVLSETTGAILRAESREKLFNLVCEAAASGGKFTFVTVIVSDPVTSILKVVARAGTAAAALAAMRAGSAEYRVGDHEMVVAAFKTGEPCFTNDYVNEQRHSVFYKLSLASGTKSVAALPLLNGGEAVGCVMLVSDVQGMFSPDFVELLLRLAGNVSFALENLERAAEREQAEEKIKFLATHDSLTGLPNRAMFNQLLNFSIANGRRHQRQCAVLFIDLDRFKLINDSLGHAAGDMLLIEMANRLTSVVRSSDLVARLGGDEFVILLNEISGPEQAITVAHNLLTSFSRPLELGGHECRITASIGIAMFPDDGIDEESLMKKADIAMYLAKAEGKNDVRLFSTDIKTQSIDQLRIETSLQHAVDRNELCLHYQPKQDVLTGQIAGVEALVRWNHPELGMIPPMQFIPLAEETGLIVAIGRWVMNTACAQNMEWQRSGLPPMSMAVNVSPRQFSDEFLLQDIDNALVNSGMEPKYLQIEITESMVMLNVERAIRVLDAIQSRGVRLAIDDFGTGYSSMSMLKRFPIDTIKIDRSFVRDLPDSSEDKAIAEAIISMGKALGLTIVAEGVETIEQDKFLRDRACDEIQGFLFSKPVTPERMVELLNSMPPRPPSSYSRGEQEKVG